MLLSVVFPFLAFLTGNQALVSGIVHGLPEAFVNTDKYSRFLCLNGSDPAAGGTRGVLQNLTHLCRAAGSSVGCARVPPSVTGVTECYML